MSENVKLQLKQFIKAKPEKCFEAWTNPELMKKWYAPGEMFVPKASSDPKVGGSYLVEMKGEMNGQQVNPTAEGKYTKIIPNELVAFTWKWQHDSGPETLVTVEFKAVDGGTEVILTHERFPSSDARDRHQHGWNGCLVNLAKFLSH